MPPAVPASVMCMCGCAALLLGRRLSVQKSFLNIHAQLRHFFETLGSDEVLPLTFRFIFLDPSQLFYGLDKNIAHCEWVDWPQTVFVFVLGFHSAPLIDGGKMLTQFRVLSGHVERTARARQTAGDYPDPE
jgi:hypothetical protein